MNLCWIFCADRIFLLAQAQGTKDKAGEYTQAAQHKAGELTGAGKDHAGSATDTAKDYLGTAQDKAKSTADQAGSKVRAVGEWCLTFVVSCAFGVKSAVVILKVSHRCSPCKGMKVFYYQFNI